MTKPGVFSPINQPKRQTEDYVLRLLEEIGRRERLVGVFSCDMLNHDNERALTRAKSALRAATEDGVS